MMAFENDPEGYRMAQRYAGNDFDKRRIRPIETLRESASSEWGLAEFEEVIDAAIAAIPKEYRDVARVELEDIGYQDSNVILVIRYSGPEPQSEVDDRIARCVEYVRKSRAEERAAYEHLKAKFG